MQPSTVIIPLEHIKAKAETRPPGYMEKCLSMGEVKDGALHLTPEAHAELLAEFGGKGGGCCGG